LLAEHLGVPAGSVSIVGPAHARIKQFDVAGLDLDQVLTRLAAGSSS
jgi:uncharacterized protein YggU (UPF0235/DUF167 family)